MIINNFTYCFRGQKYKFFDILQIFCACISIFTTFVQIFIKKCTYWDVISEVRQ
jgi:hypothetical protein